MDKQFTGFSISGEKQALILLAVVTLVILIGGYFYTNKQDQRLNKPLLGEKPSDLGATHVTRGQSHPAYNSNPPTTGWHWGDGVAGPGIKNEQVPDELVLHSMEHGAAVVWYKDTLSQSDVQKIKTAFNSATGKRIMVPRKNLDVPVALTSWGRILKLKSIDEAKIKEFIEVNNDRAPEKAPI